MRRLQWSLFLACLSLAGVILQQGTAREPISTADSSNDPVFIGAGDIANCETFEHRVTAQILDRLPGATVFTTGDNAYPRGTAQEFQDCYEPYWGRHKHRTYPSPGNHDYYSPNAKPYYEYFGDRAGPDERGYYHFRLGEWQIFSLNSNIEAQTGSPQEQWLRQELTANPSQCTLAFWHHPLFTSGLHGNDAKMKDIWKTLYEFGADVVVNGHEHDYERYALQTPDGKLDRQHGIREFVVGTGGTSLRPVAVVRGHSEVLNYRTHGVIKFTLHPTAYSWEFIPINGQTFTDSGKSDCVSPAQAV